MSDSNSTWKLQRTAQCAGCPWIVGNDPRDIPNGYSAERHRALASTIATPADPAGMTSCELHVFACHETERAHCVGWLMNQLGPGNNIALRMRVRNCSNLAAVRLRGEQHRNFADTLPRGPAHD